MNKDHRNIALFTAPLLFFILLFVLLPVLGTLYTSFFRDVSFMEREFVGAGNYLRLLRDSRFLKSLLFTLVFALLSVGFEMILGMGAALVLNETFPGRGLIRGIALIPWAIPAVVGARIWQLIYRFDYGLANILAMRFFGEKVNWLGTPSGALFSLVAADVWRTTPFVAIILLAGLQAVPGETHEQGKIDGAGLFQRFLYITLPAVRPVLIVALLFRTIDALRVFDIVYIMTGGGPSGTTTPVSLYGYGYFLMGDFGYGSAVSISLFLIAFILSLVFLKTGRFREAAL